MIPALLVGSQSSWRRQMDTILLAHGVEVVWWWSQAGSLSDIPPGCEVVVVATDNCSHKLSKPAMDRARKAGVPLICGPHRKTSMSPLLTKQGFPLLASLVERNGPGTFGIDVTQAAMATLPVSIILDLPMLDDDLSAPEPAPSEEPTVPTITPPASVAGLNDPALSLYTRSLPLVAAHPWITGAEVAVVLGVPFGSLFVPLRFAREALGIKAGIGAGASRIVNRALYELGCAALGCVPVAENEGPTRPPHTAKDRAGGARAALAPASAMAALVTALTPAAEPPKPVAAPAPVPALSGDLRDTKEALRLLLEAMRAEGVEHVAIGDDGEVSIRRRVVTTSTFTL